MPMKKNYKKNFDSIIFDDIEKIKKIIMLN